MTESVPASPNPSLPLDLSPQEMASPSGRALFGEYIQDANRSEEVALRERATGMVDGMLAFYGDKRPARSHSDPDVAARLDVTSVYHDGAHRRIITDADTGAVTTSLHLPKTITGEGHRRIKVVTTRYPDGRAAYEMNFLPRSGQPPITYEWSAERPVRRADRPDSSLALDVPEQWVSALEWASTGSSDAGQRMLTEVEHSWNRAHGFLRGGLVRAGIALGASVFRRPW
jgi:hypothetical protein